MALILGIDPGSHVTGFGLIKYNEKKREAAEHLSHGIILMPKDQALPMRLKVLSESMSELLSKYRPTDVVIEKIFMGKSAESAFKLGHARGVVMSLAAMSGAQVYEYATRLVKKGVAGSGSADKLQVKELVQHLLRLSEIKHLDASDALAMALYHSQALATQRVLRGMKENTL